jgi:hypothetical protein
VSWEGSARTSRWTLSGAKKLNSARAQRILLATGGSCKLKPAQETGVVGIVFDTPSGLPDFHIIPMTIQFVPSLQGSTHIACVKSVVVLHLYHHDATS